MRFLAVTVAIFALLGASPAPSPSSAAAASSAALEVARGRVDAMLRTGHADAAWFAPSFLSQISVDQVDKVIATMTKSVGAYKNVEEGPDKFVAHFANGDFDVFVHLDAQNLIDGLLFKPAGT